MKILRIEPFLGLITCMDWLFNLGAEFSAVDLSSEIPDLCEIYLTKRDGSEISRVQAQNI
jgi:hypothetical protein